MNYNFSSLTHVYDRYNRYNYKTTTRMIQCNIKFNDIGVEIN